MHKKIAAGAVMVLAAATAAAQAPAAPAPAASTVPGTTGAGGSTGANAGSGTAVTGVNLPVTLYMYGNIDLGVRLDSGATGAGNKEQGIRIDDGQWTTSRFGVRAERAIDEELTALGELQGTVVTDGTGTGTSSAFSFDRLSVVGLRHKKWGYANLGNEYTPMHRHVIRYNAAAYDGFAGANNSSGLIRIATRRANQFNYRTAKVYGFTADLQIARGETSIKQAESQVGNAQAFGLAYDSGRFSVGVAQEKQHAAAGLTDFESRSVGANFDAGFAKFYFVTGSRSGGVATTSPDFDLRASTLGVRAPLRSGTIMASVGRIDSRGSANADANAWGVNYLYPIARNVNLYAMYGQLTNKNGATRVLKGGSGGSGLFTSANTNDGPGSHTVRSLGFGLNLYF